MGYFIGGGSGRGLQVTLRLDQTPCTNAAVDAYTGEIVASDMTDRRTHVCTLVGLLLEQISKPLASLSAGAAYDTEGVYEAALNQRVRDEP